MKRKFVYVLFMMLFLSLMSTTCSSDDDINPIDNSLEINDIKNTVQSGSWEITSFFDSGVDETNHYIGYSFTFNSDGTLTASNGSETVNGTWSVTDDDSSNDDSVSSNDIDFNIFFSAPAMFNDDLTEDWEILDRSATKIELIHVSGGNGGTDTLTFEKN
ncbi:hypothetical protein [Litoribaculum gwangyangense]